MQNKSITPVYVSLVPEVLEEGKLYISKEYKSAIHLCMCGCGELTVTPLIEGEWQLTEGTDGKVSLTPSIGNYSFPCQSHYFITNNEVNFIQDGQ